MEEHIVERAVNPALQYGAFGVASVVFALVIVLLWRHLNRKEAEWKEERDAMKEERKEFAVERATRAADRTSELARLRAEYEEKHRAQSDSYSDQLAEQVALARNREDAMRKDFADLMERVASEDAKSKGAIAEALNKIYDRFIGPRGRRY